MRKLLPLIPLLFIAAACQKHLGAAFASATFERSINGSDLWDWDFSNKTADILSFTQNFYTGSLTGPRQSRWMVSFSNPQAPTNIYFTFPGTDSSASLPLGKEMTFITRITDSAPSIVTCTFDENGTFYAGSDSTFLDITIESISSGMITGTFTIQLYSPASTVMITEGHFTNVPLTLQ